MARKKNNALDKARQALLKKSKQTLKAQTKRAAKKKKQRIHEFDLDIVSQWRALNKVGVLQTKKSPSLKNLTPAMKRNVRKAFRDLQGVNHYAGGRLHHPLIKEQYKTKSGQKRTRYKVGQFFQFTKTKQKLNEEYKGGVIQTKKGFIFEKSSAAAKVRIRKGDLLETAHGVKWLRKAYRGEAILKLRDDIANGRLVLREGQYLNYKPWGSQRLDRGLTTAEDFVAMVDEYERDMSPTTFESWKDYSEIYFAEI
jgi:hypothetical protein